MIGTKGKGGKEEEKAVGVSQCTFKSWQRHIWGRQLRFIHVIFRPVVPVLALSADRDGHNDNLFVLLIFSISFKILCRVFYCKVSALHSGNCHFAQKQEKTVHSSNKKTPRISISLKCSQGSARGDIDLDVQEKPSVSVRLMGQAAASVVQGNMMFPRDLTSVNWIFWGAS